MLRKSVSVINSIKVPKHMVVTAIQVRNDYVNYFKSQRGIVSSTLYEASDKTTTFTISILSYGRVTNMQALVNAGFGNPEGRTSLSWTILEDTGRYCR